MNTIVLITDFGTEDHYAGVMKGVIKTINPDCDIIDLTHGIQSQNIKAGAITLANNYRFFPKGAIFVCVVDPAVGTSRKALIVDTGDYTFIAPDNGLLTYAIQKFDNIEAFEINPQSIPNLRLSNTFHGRDLFATTAAYLSSGRKAIEFGNELPIVSIALLPELPTADENGNINGEIYRFDKFGNAITDIKIQDLNQIISLNIEGSAIDKFFNTYGECPTSEPFAYIGSDGFVEIAIKNGSYKNYSGKSVQSKVLVQINLEVR